MNLKKFFLYRGYCLGDCIWTTEAARVPSEGSVPGEGYNQKTLCPVKATLCPVKAIITVPGESYNHAENTGASVQHKLATHTLILTHK